MPLIFTRNIAPDQSFFFYFSCLTITKQKDPGDYKCLSDTQIKEYHPFQLFSYDLDNYVSKKINSNLLVGGVNGDKTFQQLQLCVVSLDSEECTTAVPSACIYQDVSYLIRVLKPSKGYLRTNGDLVNIVKYGSEASYFRLSRGDDWGLRIAPVRGHGSQGSVLATTKAGKPISVKQHKLEDISQAFDLVKPRKETLDVECAI